MDIDYTKYGAQPEIDYTKYGYVPENQPKSVATAPTQNLQQSINKRLDPNNRTFTGDLAWGAGHALGEIPSGIGHLLGKAGIPGAETASNWWDKQLGQLPSTWGTSIGHLGGDIAGMLGGGAALKGAAKAAELPGLLGKSVASLGDAEGAGAMANRLTTAGGMGAIQNPDNPQLGTALGLGAGGIGEAIPMKPLSKISDWLMGAVKGRTSPEAEHFYNMAGNLPIPYGEKPRDVMLNILGNVPGAGVKKRVDQVRGAFDDLAQQIGSKLKGDSSDTSLASDITSSINKNYEVRHQKSGELYQNVADMAKKGGVQLDETPNLNATAKYYLDNPHNPLTDPQRKAIAEYANPNMGFSFSLGNVKEPLDFSGAVAKTQEFNKNARELSDGFARGMHGELSKALKQDMQQAVEKSGNQDVMDALTAANKHYKEEVVPYKSNFPVKLRKDEVNLEGIQNTLSQDSGDINKIVEDLPQNVRDKIALLKLKSAFKDNPDTGERELNPRRLLSNYSRMSPVQRENLLDDETKDMFQRLNFLGQHSVGTTYARPEGRTIGTAAAAAATIPIWELINKGSMAGLLGGVGTVGGLSLLGNAGTRALTNPRLGRAYLSRNPDLTANPQSEDIARRAIAGGLLGTANRFTGAQ